MLPEVEVVDGRLRFVIPLGWTDSLRRSCDCSICVRPPGSRPAWMSYEPDVECVWKSEGGPARKRSGTGHASAA